jgi:predicted DNA-binding transcriptional regulator AlpA
MKSMKEKEVLINRSQMLKIARYYRIFVSKSTIHRWANEPDFPYPVGQNGRYLLYSSVEYNDFLKRKVKRIQEEH